MSDQKRLFREFAKQLGENPLLEHDAIAGSHLRTTGDSLVELRLRIGNGYVLAGTNGRSDTLHTVIDSASTHGHDPDFVRNTLRHAATSLERSLRLVDEDANRGIPAYPVGRAIGFVRDGQSGLTTISLENPTDATSFWLGAEVFASSGDGSEKYHTLRGGSAIVRSIDMSSGEVSVTGAISGLAANDYLFLEAMS